jgi:ABC transport system ATP-binding/permease protein
MRLFVVAVMAQLVLCGGMVPVTGRLGLDQIWLLDMGMLAALSTFYAAFVCGKIRLRR